MNEWQFYTFLARLTAIHCPLGSWALYTVPKPPSPILKDDEKLCVAFAIWLKLRWTDPNLSSLGDIAYRGLGGGCRDGFGLDGGKRDGDALGIACRHGLAATFSRFELPSKEEDRSTATIRNSQPSYELKVSAFNQQLTISGHLSLTGINNFKCLKLIFTDQNWYLLISSISLMQFIEFNCFLLNTIIFLYLKWTEPKYRKIWINTCTTKNENFHVKYSTW